MSFKTEKEIVNCLDPVTDDQYKGITKSEFLCAIHDHAKEKEMKDFRLNLAAILLLSLINFSQMNAQTASNSNHSLNAHQQSLARIVGLTTVGNLEQLKTELATGLDAGMTINEIKEALVQLYAYTGFPRSLNALTTFMTVVEERQSRGVKDVLGNEASPVSEHTSTKYETGKRTLQELTGKEEKTPTGVNAFAPAIDTFLKEHLFADIFSRDVLNARQREFVTISALAAMTGVARQLQAHISMGMNTGISKEQISEIFSIIEKTIGKKEADVARKALSQVVASTGK